MTIERFGVKTSSLRARSPALGRQPAEGRARPLFALAPTVVVLSEPTRGIDVGAKSEVYRSSRTWPRPGGRLMVSSELPELLGLADRILVMFRGASRPSSTDGGGDRGSIAAIALGRQHRRHAVA